MDLNTIDKSNTNWNDESTKLNDNFNKINVETTQLQGIANGGGKIFASVALLEAAYTDLGTSDAGLYGYVQAGKEEVVRLTFTAGVTTAGNILITMGGTQYSIAVTTDYSTAALLAAFIATQTFTGYIVSYTSGNTYIDFTCNTVGVKTPPLYNAGSTGVTGTIEETMAGVNSLSFPAEIYRWTGTTWVDTGATGNGGDAVENVQVAQAQAVGKINTAKDDAITDIEEVF